MTALVSIPRRTPFGRRGKALAGAHPAWLLAELWKAQFAAAGLDPQLVSDAIVGCVQQIGEQAYNVGRTAWLWADFPKEIPAVTVERQCTSGQQAAIFAGALIDAGLTEAVAVAGVESLTRIPMRAPYANGPGERYPAEFRARYDIPPQGESAERIAERWGVTRADADEFALQSQTLAQKARADGLVRDQIVPITVDGDVVTEDEGLRDTSLDALGALTPTFRENGVHTAGNSSQITDGASAVLVTSPAFAEAHSLEPVLVLEDSVVAGDDPVLMLTAIMPAVRALLERNGLAADDVACYEVNEAFAAVVLAWQRELGVDPERVNPLGGAIAYGHPLAATGCRLLGSIAAALSPGERGVVTICGGGGVATASLVRRL